MVSACDLWTSRAACLILLKNQHHSQFDCKLKLRFLNVRMAVILTAHMSTQYKGTSNTAFLALETVQLRYCTSHVRVAAMVASIGSSCVGFVSFYRKQGCNMMLHVATLVVHSTKNLQMTTICTSAGLQSVCAEIWSMAHGRYNPQSDFHFSNSSPATKQLPAND